MTSLAEHQITYKKNVSIPAQFTSFLEFFTIALDHPSTLVSVSYVGWFCELFRHEHLSKSAEAISILPKLLEVCFVRSARVGRFLVIFLFFRLPYFIDNRLIRQASLSLRRNTMNWILIQR
jgi:hypothetical protein